MKKKNSWLSRYRWSPMIAAFQRVSKPGMNVKHKLSVSKEGKEQVQEFIKMASNSISKNVPLEKKLERKIKTAVVYRLYKKEGRIIKQFRRVELKEWKKLHKNPNIVGFTPNYIGFQKSKPLTLPIETWKALKTINLDGKYNHIIANTVNEYREVWTGSPDSNTNHLLSFLESNTTSLTTERIIEISLKSDWFRVPEVEFNDPREMQYMTNFNPKAYPGHITSRLTGISQKAGSVNLSMAASFSLYRTIRETATMNNTLWDVFAREKDIKVDGEEGEVGTRVVVTTEEYVSHLCSWVCNKLLASFRKVENSKFHIVGEFDGVKALQLWNRVREYDWVIDADWNKFDSTIDTQYLEAGCAMLFSNSIKTKEDERLFYFITSSIINKNVIVPPGIVINLNRGNPSGHPCVTIINCIVNMIRWSIIGYEIYGDNYHEHMDIEVYGDDALVMFKDHKNLSKIDEICKKYNFKSDPLSGNLFPTMEFGLDMQNSPDFLKRRISPAGVEWNIDKILNRILYQTKNRDVDGQLDLISDFLNTGPANDKHNEFLIELGNEIIKQNDIGDYAKEKFIDISHAIENIQREFYFGTQRMDEGFIFERDILSIHHCYYLPRFGRDNYQEIPIEILKALQISHLSFSYLNKFILPYKDKTKLFDLRSDLYYNFKFPKEWLDRLVKKFDNR